MSVLITSTLYSKPSAAAVGEVTVDEESILMAPTEPEGGQGSANLLRPPSGASKEKDYCQQRAKATTTSFISTTSRQKLLLCSAEFAYPENLKKGGDLSPLYLSMDEEATSPKQDWKVP
jgi:hypothetical protein